MSKFSKSLSRDAYSATNVGPYALLNESRYRATEERKVGIKLHSRISKGTWHHIKSRARKGPPQGVIQKCQAQERNLSAPKFEQERCVRREAWDLAKMSTRSRRRTSPRSTPQPKHVMLAPSSREVVVDSREPMHMPSKKVSSSDELETLRKSRNTTTVIAARRDVQTSVEV